MNILFLSISFAITAIIGICVYFALIKLLKIRIIILSAGISLLLSLSAGILSYTVMLPYFQFLNIMHSLEKDDPIIAAIRHYDRKAYDQLAVQIRSEVSRGTKIESLEDDYKSMGAGMIRQYIPGASDPAVIEYTRNMVSTMYSIAEINPDLAIQSILPQYYGYSETDTLTLLSTDKKNSYYHSIEEIIRTGSTNKWAYIDKLKGAAIVNKLREDYQKKYPEQFYYLANQTKARTPEEKKKVCIASVHVFQYILENQTSDTILVLKTLLSGY